MSQEEARASREEAKKRAQEADDAIKELEETDAASVKLRETLAAAQAVAPIVYKEYRRPGSKWMIEHSQVGQDYIFQVHTLKPPKIEVQGVLGLMISAMDVIFPRSLDIRYVPPSPRYKLQFYTIRVEKVVGLPGWSTAIERALASLSVMDAWPRQERG